MFLAEKTVKNYVSNLLAKLGMSRRTAAPSAADVGVPVVAAVAVVVDRHAQVPQPLGRQPRGLPGVLPHAAGEHQQVEPAGGRRHGRRLPHAAGAGRRRSQAHAASPRAPGEHLAQVPGRAGQALQPGVVLEDVAQLGRATPPCSSSQSSKPGSTVPGRVFITSPASGVKPMVVSTETPPRTAASEAPAPRWQVTIRSSADRPADELGRPPRRVGVARARGSRTGAAPSARSTPAAARRWPRRRQRRVEGGVEAGHRRHVGQQLAAGADAGQRAGLVQRRQVADRAQRPARACRRRRTGPVCRGPPCTTRWPTASTGPQRARNVRQRLQVPLALQPSTVVAASTVPSSSSRLSLRLLDPALTTRTLIARRQVQLQSRTSRQVLAVLGRSSPWCRTYAGARACRSRSRACGADRPQPRHPVDDVDGEVVAVDAVHHAHVERRGRRPLLLVAADVDVRVVGPPVGQPVDQPRIAVVGEDHRPVGGEERVELGVGQPVRVLGRPAAASGRRR